MHLRSLNKCDHVMDDLPVAGMDLGRLDPLVLLEARRHCEVDVLIGARRSSVYSSCMVKHNVGLADLPSFSESGRGGEVFWAALLRASVNPGGYRVDFLLGESRFV